MEFPILAVLFIAHYKRFLVKTRLFILSSHLSNTILALKQLSFKHDCAHDKRSNIDWKFHQFRLSIGGGFRIWQWGGARFVGKRVTYMSESSSKRSEYKSAGGRGRCKPPPPPRKYFEFRTPESESERNLTNYFIIFLLLFY